MVLSKVIAIKNWLDEKTPIAINPIVSSKLGPILNIITENAVEFTQLEKLANNLSREYKEIFRFFGDFECTVEEIKIKLQEMIEQNSESYFVKSFKNYSESIAYENNKVILDRKLPIFNEVADQLVARIMHYNNWKYVGMIIRPGTESWIQNLVGCDPLYLVDTCDELLEPALSKFNNQYRNRLRTYTVTETENSVSLEYLPNNQFGFCLIYNFFNYKPIEIIEIYLKELYQKMKPGGVIAFTFNDCDRAEAVELFENGFMSYTPSASIISLCKSVGFEIKYNFRLDHSCTWIEIIRPGETSSIKGGQSLAKILYKDEYYHYTVEEQNKIIIEESDININKLYFIIEIKI